MNRAMKVLIAMFVVAVLKRAATAKSSIKLNANPFATLLSHNFISKRFPTALRINAPRWAGVMCCNSGRLANRQIMIA